MRVFFYRSERWGLRFSVVLGRGFFSGTRIQGAPRPVAGNLALGGAIEPSRVQFEPDSTYNGIVGKAGTSLRGISPSEAE